MIVLFIADIVGQPGRDMVRSKLSALRDKEKTVFVIANAENAAGGKGLTGIIANELFNYGVDVITLGNHAFDRREVEDAIDNPKILRPANYPSNVPGRGFGVYETDGKVKIAVVNLMGRVYMPLTDCPFRKANEILDALAGTTKNIIVDFHAEITSEKQAFGYYMDGRASAVLGTHTHIPTADERVLPGGTAYISDTGMTGPADGVIGMDKEIILKKYLTGLPQHFAVSKGGSIMQGCVIDINQNTGKAVSIKRFSIV